MTTDNPTGRGWDPDETRDLCPSLTIPGYRVERVLGEGGMGRVYLAEDIALGRRVAIKVVAEHIAGDPESRSRFLNEARALAAIRHDNVVKVHSFGEVEGRPYIVMEYVDGQSLAAKVAREGPLDPGKALAVVEAAARGLEAGWRAGLVHRDVKPGNILVEDGGRVVVTDFGLARSRHRASGSTLTSPGAFLGTPGYVSPEQALGRPDVDFRSDIYSLGLVLYELLTASAPFTGDSPYAVVEQQVHAPVPSLPGELGGERGLDELIRWMTAKERERRPGSYDELIARLHPAGSERTASAAPTGRLVMLAGGLTLAVVVAVASLLWLQTRKTPLSPGENLVLDFTAFRKEWLAEQVQRTPARVTVDASRGMAAAEVLGAVADQAALNVVLAPDVALGDRVYASFQDLPWTKVLDVVTAQAEAWYDVTDGTLILVMPRTAEATWFRADLRTDVAVIVARDTRAADHRWITAEMVRRWLSPVGSVDTVHRRDGARVLVVSDTPTRVDFVLDALDRLGAGVSAGSTVLNRLDCTATPMPPSPSETTAWVLRSRALTPASGEDATMDLRIETDNIQDLVGALLGAANLSYAFAPAVTGTVSIDVHRVSPGTALDSILAVNGIQAVCLGSNLYFTAEPAQGHVTRDVVVGDLDLTELEEALGHVLLTGEAATADPAAMAITLQGTTHSVARAVLVVHLAQRLGVEPS